METNARYVWIGVFLLAVIGAAFSFVFWLYDSGGLQSRSLYRVRFDGSVSGLLTGSAVLFNGIRVGEVAELSLDPKKPSQVLATLAVRSDTPVRTDTTADIDFQGFTGSPAVALRGGTASRRFQTSGDDPPPILTAAPGAGETMTSSANRLLRRIDSVIEENSTPLREGIAGLSTFAKALSRNSDRVDGILIGLERMTGGGAKAASVKTYDLAVARVFEDIKKIPTSQLAVPEPIMLNAFNSNRIAIRGEDNQITRLEDAQWADALPLLIQSKMIRSFENAGYQRVLSSQAGAFDVDHQLVVDVRSFGFEQAPASAARIALSAKILDRDGRIVDTRHFQSRGSVEDISRDAISSIELQFQTVTRALVPWVLNVMARQTDQPQDNTEQ